MKQYILGAEMTVAAVIAASLPSPAHVTVSDTVDVSFTSRSVTCPGTGGRVWGVVRHGMQDIHICAYKSFSGHSIVEYNS